MSQNLTLGQHFLMDENVLKKEIEVANLSKKDKVIEIGCGEGFLTEELIKKSGEVLGFEIDDNYKEVLEKIKDKKLKIIFDNALNYSWKDYNKIVSNIPYYLSEGIIKKAIFEKIDLLILIVGEKFKINIEENKRFLGVLINIFYEVEFISKVDKSSFNPAPRVDSWIVKLKFKKENYFTKFMFDFLYKSGKIKNNLIFAFRNKGLTKREAKEKINFFEIDKRILEKSSSRITGRVLKKVYEKIQQDLKT